MASRIDPTDETAPLLRRIPLALGVPPVAIQPGVEKLHSPVTMAPASVFPEPTFSHALHDAQKRRMPQCIAHRGYKAAYPENTLAAFRGAAAAGAHALETDVHITKDDVVVISHDATLKRCFGRPEKIIDCTWDELKSARTIAEPHEPMPRLQDLLEYLAQPGLEEIWLLLDIKLDNDANNIMRLLGTTLASVSPPARKAWQERIILGIWAAKYLPLAQKYLPGYPVTHIGFSVPYARHFFDVPGVNFNMLLPVLVMPGGARFLRDAREKYHRSVLAWTVNEADKMEWCIRRRLDGVITDDPKKFLQVCERFDEKRTQPLVAFSLKGYADVVRIWVWISVLLWFYGKRFLPVASADLIKKNGET